MLCVNLFFGVNYTPGNFDLSGNFDASISRGEVYDPTDYHYSTAIEDGSMVSDWGGTNWGGSINLWDASAGSLLGSRAGLDSPCAALLLLLVGLGEQLFVRLLAVFRDSSVRFALARFLGSALAESLRCARDGPLPLGRWLFSGWSSRV